MRARAVSLPLLFLRGDAVLFRHFGDFQASFFNSSAVSLSFKALSSLIDWFTLGFLYLTNKGFYGLGLSSCFISFIPVLHQFLDGGGQFLTVRRRSRKWGSLPVVRFWAEVAMLDKQVL